MNWKRRQKKTYHSYICWKNALFAGMIIAAILIVATAKGRTVFWDIILCILLLLQGIGTVSEAKKRHIVRKKIFNIRKKIPGSQLPESEEFSYVRTMEDLNCIEVFLEQSNKLTAMHRQAELYAFQQQIDPHFLYNALDSIRGEAIFEEAPKTEKMLEALSVLFRYTISQPGGLRTFEQELNNTDHYIQIQQYRFSERFTIIKAIDQSNRDIMDYKLPRLIIQPLIENAIKHGLNGDQAVAEITLRAYMTDKRFVICVADNGCGIPLNILRQLNKSLEEANSFQQENQQHKGLGLINVDQRIKLYFGKEYGLTINSLEGIGTEIQITLPNAQTQVN